MFAEGVNEANIDVVDGDPENQNNHVLGHSFSEGVSVLCNHGHAGRSHIHFAKAADKKRCMSSKCQ